MPLNSTNFDNKTLIHTDVTYTDEVRMWVYEEVLPTGENLTDTINQTNVSEQDITKFCLSMISNRTFSPETYHLFMQENVKYLAGIKLGKNVVADPNLENAGMHVS